MSWTAQGHLPCAGITRTRRSEPQDRPDHVEQMADAHRLTVTGGITINRADGCGRRGDCTGDQPALALARSTCSGGRTETAATVSSQRVTWPKGLDGSRLGSLGRFSGAMGHHAGRCEGTVEALEPASLDAPAFMVDALFGARLNRALAGPSAGVLAAAASRGLPVFEIDVPTRLAPGCSRAGKIFRDDARGERCISSDRNGANASQRKPIDGEGLHRRAAPPTPALFERTSPLSKSPKTAHPGAHLPGTFRGWRRDSNCSVPF